MTREEFVAALMLLGWTKQDSIYTDGPDRYYPPDNHYIGFVSLRKSDDCSVTETLGEILSLKPYVSVSFNTVLAAIVKYHEGNNEP